MAETNTGSMGTFSQAQKGTLPDPIQNTVIFSGDLRRFFWFKVRVIYAMWLAQTAPPFP